MIKAVFFDFGGVILESPFEAFDRFEVDNGLPAGFLRQVNGTNPDDNAWARLERSQVTIEEFCAEFEAECRAAGHRVDGLAILGLLSGEVRPAMVEALHRIKAAGVPLALLTNNFVTGTTRSDLAAVITLFDVVVESSKVRVRKPDPRFYELACELVGVDPPDVVFLDDLGVNLKPARAIGMTTIKVEDPGVALKQLEDVLGFGLTAGAKIDS